MANYYKPGTWNVICMLCGRKFKSDQVKKRWDGLIVCENDYETRNILDFTRVMPEMGAVPWSAPENVVDEFVFFCYIDNRLGGADIYTAGCMEAA